MKMILTVALVLLAGGILAAADKVDPVGTWKCEYKIGDQKRTATLTITKDGDTVAGTMSWPDQKDVKLKDVKLKEAELTFSVVREFMENKIPIDYKLTVDGDKIKGKATSDFGGQKQEFEIEASREKMASKKDK
jgi:hypothetical protein